MVKKDRNIMNKKQFKELNINPKLMKAIDKMGFSEMTSIQQKTFQPISDGKDVMALAPTGTGKTCAFGLPILEKTDTGDKNPATIIICPTRELAKQIADVLHNLTTFMQGIKVVSIYGGENINRQIQKLKGKPQIIVATPGRLLDHLNRRTVRMDNIKHIVLDEADRMLDMGFRKDMDTIIKAAPQKCQMLLFSATMSKEIKAITNKYLKKAVSIKIESKSRVVDTVKQYSAEVDRSGKMAALVKLFNEKSYDSSLVFVRTKSRARQLSRKLGNNGFDALSLHGDLNQRQRDAVMRKYRNGKVSILVATDVASRGIDVFNIDAVINYDIPEDSDSYVHRIGRTGRANNRGDAYTFLDPSERKKMKNIIKSTNTEVKSISFGEK